ncbi:hypothetical protein GGI08_006539 [Coemansia sp. S2]|nr:hypothetical protein GGI08_006539 [Coemansia sp. S2]
MIRPQNIKSSQTAEANISAFVRMIKQPAPGLYQLFSRVEYDLPYFSRLPMVLPLARICNLVSHPRLKFVNTNFCGDLPKDRYDSTIDCLQFALSVGPKAAVRHIYGRFGDANLLSALLLFSDNPCIQVLMLPILEFKLCDVIALVKSLPLLSELTTGPPYLEPIPINITTKDPPAYVVSKHYPMGKRF